MLLGYHSMLSCLAIFVVKFVPYFASNMMLKAMITPVIMSMPDVWPRDARDSRLKMNWFSSAHVTELINPVTSSSRIRNCMQSKSFALIQLVFVSRESKLRTICGLFSEVANVLYVARKPPRKSSPDGVKPDPSPIRVGACS